MYSSTRQTEVYCAVIQQLTIIVLLQKWRLSMMQTREKCMVFQWRFTHVTITYIPQPEKPTPYKKWTEIREKHPDCLLLVRVGDYYECYNEDAVKAAEILGTPLINRHTKELNKMTGFPYDRLYKYLPKLIRASQRVAICDQLTTPQK